jgi:hypothetical protein
VAYLDLTGSGAETIAHLRENGRIVFMFCEMSGAPRIVRLHGTGRVVLPGTPEWAEHAPRFEPHPGARTIILADIERVAQYREEKNSKSIDGLPGLPQGGA